MIRLGKLFVAAAICVLQQILQPRLIRLSAQWKF